MFNSRDFVVVDDVHGPIILDSLGNFITRWPKANSTWPFGPATMQWGAWHWSLLRGT